MATQLHFPGEIVLSHHLQIHPASRQLCQKDARISQILAQAFANKTTAEKDLQRWIVLSTFDKLELWKNPRPFLIRDLTEALQASALRSAL